MRHLILSQVILCTKQANFILCSHVLYYIEQAQWLANIERLVSWLATDGLLVVVLQNHRTDCMRMLQHFFGHHYNLAGILPELKTRLSTAYDITCQVEPAHIWAEQFADIYIITEFMLNLVKINMAPPKQEVSYEMVRTSTS